MAAGLYGSTAAIFSEQVDRAFTLLGSDGPALREMWLDERPPAVFHDVTVAQPLLYLVECALGKEVLGWGVEPAAMLGHSVGEMVAATLAGVLDFEDGIRLMRARMHDFADTPAGGMLAVAASAEQVRDHVDERIHLAAVNAAKQVLLAGRNRDLDAVAAELSAAGYTCRRVPARQAFHSPLVRGAALASVDLWSQAGLRPPQRVLYSSYSQARVTDELAQDPRFWALQPAETVMFGPTLDALLRTGPYVLLEVGPGNSLSTLARRHPSVRRGSSAAVPLLPAAPAGDLADKQALATAATAILGGHRD
jgi:acyl transferase domain-containing protein